MRRICCTRAIIAASAVLLGACAGEATRMPQPNGSDARAPTYDTGAVPTYDSYVFPDTSGTPPAPDIGGGSADDASTGTSTPASCSSSAIRIGEVAVGTLDYVALVNKGSASIDLAGYKLAMYGINGAKPVEYTFSAKTVAAGATVYVLEYESGTPPADVNTKKNIPFYNGPPSAMKPDAVVLYDAQGGLVDYWAVDQAVGMPANASFTPLQWGSFDSKTNSFQRVANTGSCPSFAASDWSTAPLTR